MRRAIWVCFIFAATVPGCTRDTAVSDPCPDCPANISFSASIIPIFKSNCLGTGCHSTTSHEGGVNLDSAFAYASVTEPGSGNVIAGNANYSLLYTLLFPKANIHMPVNGQLDPCDIQKIACWINQGAVNN
jgi:hypothetical protein